MWTFAQEEFCQDGNAPVQRGFESPPDTPYQASFTGAFIFFTKITALLMTIMSFLERRKTCRFMTRKLITGTEELHQKETWREYIREKSLIFATNTEYRGLLKDGHIPVDLRRIV